MVGMNFAHLFLGLHNLYIHLSIFSLIFCHISMMHVIWWHKLWYELLGPWPICPPSFIWDILKNERILTTTIVYIRLYIYIYIYIFIYIPIYLYTYSSHCIEPMFSEHLSPEAKPRGMCGSMLLEACGMVWSRLQGAAAACLNEHCMQLDCLLLHRPRKEWNVRQSLPGSQLIE